MKMKFFIFIFLAIILVAYIYIQISFFKVNEVKLNSEKIKDDIKIVQVSDFHNNRFINKKRFIKKIKSINPDIIVLTGDIIDAKTKDFDYSISMIRDLKNITDKIYFVWGNHEIRNNRGKEFVEILKRMGIFVLENENTRVHINNTEMNICGVNFYIDKNDYKNSLDGIDEKSYTILLSHSPNRPISYSEGKEDLILAGHTHGGQVRFPIIGAIVAPGQGYFPKHDKGLFKIGNTTLYIDSGLGNSVFPIRFLNRIQISNIAIKKGYK
ncbi:MAG: Metallophos domain-containing protein [Sporanaerobacter sp.]|uniref:metallophosphoesterase n=1 Tax=Sporanaerobacter sp. TaxID=2010183 RepID=UPI003A10326F